MVHVSFTCSCSDTQWGDTLLIVGSAPEIGSWDPQRGRKLSTDASSYPAWSCACQLDVSTHSTVEYKFVVHRADGSIAWEPLVANRQMMAAAVGGSHLMVVAKFGSPEEQTHQQQQPPAHFLEPVQTHQQQQPPAPLMAPAPAAPGLGALASAPPPPPRLAASTPPIVPRGVPAPLALGSPLANRSNLHTRSSYPLDPIASMDQSWPPSLSPSLENMDGIDEADEAAGVAAGVALEGIVTLRGASQTSLIQEARDVPCS